MRIVGGRLSGRRFGAPSGRGTRPTSDRVREALGSALEARGALDGANVLDLFAGTGALSFEALSRGAAYAVLVDHDPGVLRQIRRSAAELGLTEHVRTARIDLLGEPGSVLSKLPAVDGGYGLIFTDAPYAEIDSVAPLLERLAGSGLVAPEARFIVEHRASHHWTWPNRLAPEAEYRYGQTGISLGVFAAEKGRQ